ncbi:MULTISPECIES: succinylglutamate desuccinylase/aspartoacylase family protein [Halorussus]|uniref:succinylglutamate desuccinylase/aspartoacylase family protein n=1 Tax=Halorussus TaxID=1070314 RepID=UPI0020A15C7D|nr:succinylglutamate desuccinylase/aspartoacylase family protein [Halorussus vallis]USZ77556.1 succinylglutamate desuccinylase/aspartoacylase family protein [Halorussus vallis]
MKVGTAETSPGESDAGYLSVTDLPTGGADRLPVVVVDGEESGPTVWVTGAVHGDETTGMAAAQDFAAHVRGDLRRGTVVCVPVANPAGLRTNARTSYYHDDDPNRHFESVDPESARPPRVQQVVDERLYERIADTADALVDLHTSWVATYPYTIQPRVPYGENRDESAASDLSDRITALVEAFGLPVVRQFGREEIRRRSLQGTLTGAAVGRDGIPAFTPELGGRYVVEEDARRAAVAGLHNVCHSLGMVAEPMQTEASFSLPADGPLKRLVHPHADAAGIVRYRVSEGDRISAGQAVADIVSPHGTIEATVESRHDGFVLSRMEGAAVYENDPLLDLAVPDDEPLVVPED